MKAAIVFHVKSFLAQAHAEEPQPKATKRHHEEGLLHTRGCARGSLNSGEHSPGCMGICIYTYVHKHVPKYIYIRTRIHAHITSIASLALYIGKHSTLHTHRLCPIDPIRPFAAVTLRAFNKLASQSYRPWSAMISL